MFKKRCRHNWGNLIKEGYLYFQRCNHCGKMEYVEYDCPHKWKIHREFAIEHSKYNLIYKYILCCEYCGQFDTETVYIGVTHYEGKST